MSAAKDQFAKAFREARDAFGVSIAFGAVTVTAVVQESTLSRELVAGGFEAQAEFQARCLSEDLGTIPVLGSPVTYNGRDYKVTDVAVQPDHPVVEFRLRPAGR